MSATKYYGKYRGMVLNNIDPMQIGRLQVQVPDVTGLAPATWAMPCTPLAGIQNGMFALPLIGSGVWVEFEQGDPEHPIWVGCFWGSAAEVPALALATACFLVRWQEAPQRWSRWWMPAARPWRWM